MVEKEKLQERLWLENLQVELGGTFTWAYDELEDSFSINGERYTIKALLGEGSFGAVYHCTAESVEDGSTVQDFAVKIISTDRISIITGCDKQNVIRRMLHEAEVLGSLGGHPHIVQLYTAAISQSSLRIFMVMQLLRCCDLFNELLRRRKAFPEDEARSIVRQLAMAVSHCHRRNIAHRDLKLENIMLASRHPPVLKLIDFGQAQLQGVHVAAPSRSVQTAKTLTTSSLYTPPDVKQAIQENESYDAFKLDAFGIGVICYGLLCSSLPEAAKGGDFQKGPKWKALSANAQDLILQLLCSNANDRISVTEVLQHPFVTTVNSTSLSSRMTTPCDFEHELQALMSTQALATALQQERGASCWMLDGSEDAEMRCKWMCEAANDQFTEAIDAIENLPGEKGVELGKTLRKIRSDTETIRKVSRGTVEQDGHSSFDTVFASYCKILEEVIHLIGRLMVVIQKQEATLTVAEVRIRLLMLVAEQLGRERGFICGHLRRRNLLMSLDVQKRFAKIQGCRQYLLGSTCPESAESGVVSFESGLLPNLRLADSPLVSREDLVVLEDAESAVLGGKSTASEWFTTITAMIDKVHQQARVSFLGLIEDIRQQGSVAATPQFSQGSGDPTPHPRDETPAQSEKSMPERAGSMPTAGGSSPARRNGGFSDDHRGYAGSQQMNATSKSNMTPPGPTRRGQETRETNIGEGFHHQKTSDFQRNAGSSSGPTSTSAGLGTYGHSVPMKVTSSFGPELDSPDPTPIHPGLWQSRGFQPAPMFSHPPERQNERMSAFQGQQPEKMFHQQGSGNNVPERRPRHDVVMSTGTIGHPTSCRGLGCKFASKDRGCKEAEKCLRCHLCVWQRAPEKDAQRLQQGNSRSNGQSDAIMNARQFSLSADDVQAEYRRATLAAREGHRRY